MKCLVFGSGIVRIRPDPVFGRTWLGSALFEGTTGPLMQSLLVLAVLWTFCWWLWKRKVLIRI